jgi:hypothetical protein
LLELATWEDYGLGQAVHPFLQALEEPLADRALALLASIIRELREHELEHALGKARALRAAILASAQAFPSE